MWSIPFRRALFSVQWPSSYFRLWIKVIMRILKTQYPEQRKMCQKLANNNEACEAQCASEMPKCSTVFMPFVERFSNVECGNGSGNTMRQSMRLSHCLIPQCMENLIRWIFTCVHYNIRLENKPQLTCGCERDAIDFHFHVGFVQIKAKNFNRHCSKMCSLLEITWDSFTNCGFAFTTGETFTLNKRGARVIFQYTLTHEYEVKAKPHFYKRITNAFAFWVRVCVDVSQTDALFVCVATCAHESHDEALLAVHAHMNTL